MKKIAWFAKGVLMSVWVIGVWLLLAEVLQIHERWVVWLVAVLSLGRALFDLLNLIKMSVWLSLGPLAVALAAWLLFGAEATVVVASVIFGLTRMREFPTGDWSFWTLLTAILPLAGFAWTINLGWKTALVVAGIMLAGQLALLYLPVHSRERKAT